MSRQIPLDELNKKIDEKVKEYEEEAASCREDLDKGGLHGSLICQAKAEALTDFQLDINEPKPIIDVSENIDQTIHVEEAKKIINDEL